MPPVLVTLRVDADDRAALSKCIPPRDIRFAPEPSDEDLSWARVVFGNVQPDRLLGCPDLEWLHSPNAGLDAYGGVRDLLGNLLLTNSSGVSADAVAEHGLALLFGLTRNLPVLLRSQSARVWDRSGFAEAGQGTTLIGKEAHVLGFGPIGRALVSRLRGIGMRTVVYRRSDNDADETVDRFVSINRLTATVPTADVVVNALPLTPATTTIVDGSVLGAMKPGAYLVNIGRGATIDETALIASLRSGRLAGAGLDVFLNEPLPGDSPLWAMPNVIVSPHVGGRFDREVQRHVECFLDLWRDRYESPSQ